MLDSRPLHGLPGRLQTAGPAGGDERPASGESAPRRRLGSGSEISRLTEMLCCAESGARQGDVSAQEQHREGPFLPEAEISESQPPNPHRQEMSPWSLLTNDC